MDRSLGVPATRADLKAVPGPRWNPIRSARMLVRDPSALARTLHQQYGEVAFVNALGRDVVIAQGPALAEEIVRNRDRAFANGPVYGYAIGRFFQRGVLLLDFEEHRDHRRIMQHAFTTERLRGYASELHRVITETVDGFPTGEVEMRSEFKALTLDVALRVFAGIDLPRTDTERLNRACADMIAAAGSMVRAPLPGTLWRRGIRGRATVTEFFRAILPAKRADPGADLFSALCSAQDPDGAVFTDDEIVDHMVFMLFAAHDTATIALTSAAYQLAKSSDWQERSRAEAVAAPDVLGYGDLADLTTLDLVMREAIRLRPPVPALPRATRHDTALGEYFIPAGTFVVVLVEANHHMPEVWENPDEFDPLRFTRDLPHRMAWMPFGGGPHQCLGMNFARLEVLTTLHHLLRAFEWSVPTDHVMDDRGLTFNAGFTATVRRRSPIRT
ncbi:cytochrome P450 [Tsukamurella sp. 8F]|uniref:cytochrome P450 n=1 Tax=unclassified Tsukamurella TaxID=2633480 RepID=UPI0023BA317C|nr:MULTISPECIES: cytochrome P450 [unclassified Tsukamurella]MDF0528662.1 cytochrome P450 [Tsukamurella sp. 8J]MDF0585624.1 cytochrome P450 [Tsukamurella sp. 8F]